MRTQPIASGVSRRQVLQTGGLLGAVSMLGACGLGESGSDKGGKGVVDFWLTPNASPEEMKAFTDTIGSSFEQAGGGKVASLVIPWENALTKYTAAFTGGTPPDVTYQIIPWMNKWRSTKVLADLRDQASESELAGFLKDQPESYLKAATGDQGEIYGIPFTQGFQPLTLNEAVWEKAGKPDLPTTLEDLIGFARKLTLDSKGRGLDDQGFDSGDVATYGMAWPAITSLETNWVWQYFWDYGVEYINDQQDDIGFDNPEGREALTVMKRLIDSGAMVPQRKYSDPSQWDVATLSGASAMQWTPPLTPELAKQFPQARLKVIPPLGGPAGKFVVAGCGYWALSAKSKDLKESYKFLKFMLEPEQAHSYVRMVRGQTTQPYEGNFYEKPLADPRMNQVLNEAAPYREYVRATLVLPYDPHEFLLGKINDYLFNNESLDDMIKAASGGVQQMARDA